MKERLLVICIFLSSHTLFAQRLTPEQIVPLFKKSFTDAKTFIQLKGYAFKKREENFYTYILEGWGNNCLATIHHIGGKIDVVSIYQSTMYFSQDYAALTAEDFTLIKSSCGNIYPNQPPIMGTGCINRFDNKPLKLLCFLIPKENGYYMNFGRPGKGD